MFKPRIYTVTDDGLPDGKPVMLSQERLDEVRALLGEYVFACQMLLNPVAGHEQVFKPEWIRRYEVRPRTLNVYIMGDYGGSKTTKTNDNTAFAVIGIDSNRNKYLLDGAVHKMNLSQRWDMLTKLRKRWINATGVLSVRVGYERYGAQSDIEHFTQMMAITGEHFHIQELAWPLSGSGAKDERIKRLQPDFENWRFFFPYVGPQTSQQRDADPVLVAKPIKQKNHEGKIYDVVEWMLANEYNFFPHSTKKDMLDAMSRIYDMQAMPAIIYNERDVLPEVEHDY